MYTGMGAVAQAIGTQAEANQDSEIGTGLTALTLIPSTLSLTQEWMKTIQTDAINYYNYQLESISNPAMAAMASAWNEQKTLDTSQSDTETGALNTLVQALKARLQIEGNAMSAIFNLESPISDLMKEITSAIMQLK